MNIDSSNADAGIDCSDPQNVNNVLCAESNTNVEVVKTNGGSTTILIIFGGATLLLLLIYLFLTLFKHFKEKK